MSVMLVSGTGSFLKMGLAYPKTTTATKYYRYCECRTPAICGGISYQRKGTALVFYSLTIVAINLGFIIF